MPNNGDSFNSGSELKGEYNFYALYQDATASSGTWFDISGARSASIHVTQSTNGDSLSVRVSNAPTLPSSSDNGVEDQAIALTGSEKFVTMTKLPARWCKISKTGTAGAATALFCGMSR